MTPPIAQSKETPLSINDQRDIKYRVPRPNEQLTFHLIEAERFLSDLNTEQRSALLIETPSLCLKGPAASGKTRTLIHKIAHLLACNADEPGDIQVIAPSVTNLESIKQQLLRMVGQVASQIRFHTPETLALACLRANPKLTGIPKRLTPILPQQETILIDEHFDTPWPFPIQVKEAHTRLQSYWEHHSGNIEMKECQEILSLFRQNEVIPVRSAVTKCLKARQTHPDLFARHVKKWLFIDDIQTLTPAACKLLKCLQKDDTNLFMTINPSLRQTPACGSTCNSETDLTADASKCTKCHDLHINHRNSRHVHRACEHVIAPIRTDASPPPPKHTGIRIQYYTLPDVSEEARFIAREIKHLQGGTPSLTTDQETSHPPVSASEIAIFVRHASQAHPIIKALEDAKMPYKNLTETTTASSILNALIPFKNRRQNKLAKDTAQDMSRLPLSESERLILQTHAKQFPGTLNEFIDRIATNPACVAPAKGIGTKHLKIMLITETTGLAFNVVFIPGCVNSVYPSPSAQHNTATFDQDRQSLYLGMSRASQLLYLTKYEHSLIAGHYKTLDTAHYLTDMPEDVIREHRGQPISDQQENRQLDFDFFGD